MALPPTVASATSFEIDSGVGTDGLVALALGALALVALALVVLALVALVATVLALAVAFFRKLVLALAVLGAGSKGSSFKVVVMVGGILVM